jgi:hypothetical protein
LVQLQHASDKEDVMNQWYLVIRRRLVVTPPVTTKIRFQETSKTRTLISLAGFLLSRVESLALLYIGGIGFV